jgi:hypothetical protein
MRFAKAKLQIAAHHIPHHIGAGVSQVAIVIDRYPADIHGDLIGTQGLKFCFTAGERVIQFQGHAIWSAGAGQVDGMI